MLTLHKYQTLGNDFLILDCINFKENVSLVRKNDFMDFVQKVSDRRRFGCDQFIVVENSTKADAKIVFYNSDGSKAEACGNGTVASGVYVSGFLCRGKITLETDSGLANIAVDGKKATIELPMPKEIELSDDNKNELLRIQSPFDIESTSVHYIHVGNPHCVLFLKNLVKEIPKNWQSVGKQIENMTQIFPHKTNVEFVREISTNAFDVLVWERGAGRTFACGTGAIAVAFTMVQQGFAEKSKPVEIYMEGSKIYGNGKPIIVELGTDSALLTNHASFEGTITCNFPAF